MKTAPSHFRVRPSSWCVRLAPWFLVWIAGLAQSQFAATTETIDQVLARQQQPASRNLLRTSDSQQAAELGTFSASLLEQYVLLSLSSWELSGTPLPEPAQLRVYEMLDSPAALGLFSLAQQEFSPQGRRLLWGLDAEVDGPRLIFWKGNFFFSLDAGNGRLPVDELHDWVLALTEQVEHPSTYPMTVVQLPETGLLRESVRFYLSDEALATNNAFPSPLLGDLGFEDRAEVTAARYEPNGRTLFLIGYPTAALAEERFATIQNQLQSVFSRDGIYMKRSGLMISLIEAPEAEAVELLDRVRYTASVRWIYEKDTSLEDRKRRHGELVTFFGIITSSLLFTGFFILVVLAGGLTLGLLRYRLLGYFPRLRSRDEMIRLDLEPAAAVTQPASSSSEP